MTEPETPPTPAEAPPANPLQMLADMRHRAEADKIRALQILKQRVAGLRHLDKISKGAGKPTICELADALSAVYSSILAQGHELTALQSLISSALLQATVREEALTSVLKEKNIVTEDDIKAAQTTIFERHKEAAAQQQKDALAQSVAQLKQ